MKISNAQLVNLIKEEINKFLKEQDEDPERAARFAAARAQDTGSAAEKAGRAYYSGDDETYNRIRGEIGDERIYAMDQAAGGRMQQFQSELASGDAGAEESEARRLRGEIPQGAQGERARRAAAARQTGTPVGGAQAAKPGAGPATAGKGPATAGKGPGATTAKAGPAKAGPAGKGVATTPPTAAGMAGRGAAGGSDPTPQGLGSGGAAAGAGYRARGGRAFSTRPDVTPRGPGRQRAPGTAPSPQQGGGMRERPAGDAEARGRETLSEMISQLIDQLI